jgi:hypothetical protein
MFTARVRNLLDEETYRRLQQELLADPDRGDVIPGCGGLRKARVSQAGRGKGKRGGARVIYLNIPEANRIYMLTVYGKDEQEDLTSDQKKVLRAIAEEVRAEVSGRFSWKGNGS